MLSTLNTDAQIAEHLVDAYSPAEMHGLRAHFAEFGFVKIPRAIPTELFAAVTGEVSQLLDAHGRRIDIHIKETGDTPRFMTTVAQKSIAADGQLIPAVYRSESLKRFLGEIAGEGVYDCPWDEEQYVIINQQRPGDTHGWHWGDFSFTVIWLIECPPAEYGGQLQSVANTYWDKDDPRTEEWLEAGPIHTWSFVPGDLYFLRSDRTLHRTIPLNRPASRTILNTCWGSFSDTQKEQTHETMVAMFDEASPAA